jgi:hypothetical protein
MAYIFITSLVCQVHAVEKNKDCHKAEAAKAKQSKVGSVLN